MCCRTFLGPVFLAAGLLAHDCARADEIWVTNQTASKVHVIDAGTFAEVAAIATGANPGAVAVGPVVVGFAPTAANGAARWRWRGLRPFR